MSKEKPEVEDVWARDYCQYHITRVQKYNNEIITIHTININLVKSSFSLETFKNQFTYIGKSKVSIKELFDVEEK